jgi:hypothetical protein
MTTEIAIITQGNAYRIAAPPGTKIFRGDRAMNVDFDIIVANGMHYLAKQVLDMAAKGEKGFRLIGFEPLPAE